MRIINNFTFPVLNLFGYKIPWEHPLFAPFLRKATPEEQKKYLSKESRFDGFKKDVWLSAGEMTADRRATWPVFALAQEDFVSLSDQAMVDIDEATSLYWAMFLHEAIPEVVPWDVWRDSYEYDEDGFSKWLKKLPDDQVFSGVILRPDEEVTSLYCFILERKDTTAFVHSMLHGFTVSDSINGNGFLSKGVEIDDDLHEAAVEFGHSDQEEFFMSEMRCIMKYIYYRESGRTQKALFHRGDSGFSGSDEYKSATDTPLIFNGNKTP